MKCLYCGDDSPENVTFCIKCGKKIGESPYTVTSTDVTNPISKEVKRKRNIYAMWQILISVIISAIVLLFLFFPYGVMVRTVHDNILSEGFSLWNAIEILIKGSGRYNATMISIVIGFGTLLFVLAVPVFQIFTIIAKILKKSQKGIRKIAIIMTSVAVLAECLLVPVAYKLVPSFKVICAREINCLLGDITGIVSWWSIVFAVPVLALMVTSTVITHKKNTIERG